MTETWLSAQGDEAKTVELAFDVKSFPRQSRSRGGGIAAVCKSTLGSNITFKTNFILHTLCSYAARVILRLPKSSSITIHLKSLHWLTK